MPLGNKISILRTGYHFRKSDSLRNVFAMAAPSPNDDYLHWNAPAVGKVLKRYGIHDRSALARRLKLSPATVYRNFEDDWSGRVVSNFLLVALCRTFNTKLSTVVRDPR